MQRCRCGECCKGRIDDPRTASLRIAGSPPSCGRGGGSGKPRTPTPIPGSGCRLTLGKLRWSYAAGTGAPNQRAGE